MAVIDPKKKYRKFVAFGCSFTSGHNYGEDGSWGKYLGNKLGCDYELHGFGGSSSTSVLSRMIGYCETHDMTDCCVGIQWSEWTRRELWIAEENRYTAFNIAAIQISDQYAHMKKHLDFFGTFFFDPMENIIRSINNMVLAKAYLESKSIDFVQYEGIGSILDECYPFPKTAKESPDVHLIKDPYKLELLNHPTFFTKYGSMMRFMFDHELFSNDPLRKDSHPNPAFAEWWASEIYNYLVSINQ
jgi:hypothetical protein